MTKVDRDRIEEYPDDQLVRELTEESDEEGAYYKQLQKEFCERFQETIMKAARGAHDLYAREGVETLVESIVLRHLHGESPESEWDRLRQYDPDHSSATFKGWLYIVSLRRLRHYALRENAMQPRSDKVIPLPEEEKKRRKVDTKPHANESESDQRLDPEGQFARSIETEHLMEMAERLGGGSRGNPPNQTGEKPDQQEANEPDVQDLAAKILLSIIEEERENLGTSDSGVEYAEVLREVHFSEMSVTERYEAFAKELRDRLPDKNRQNLRHQLLPVWAMRGRDNLQDILEEKYPEEVEGLMHMVLDPR